MKENRKAKIFETREEIISLYSNMAKALGKEHLEIFEESAYLYLKEHLTDDFLRMIDIDIKIFRQRDLKQPANNSTLRLCLEKKRAFYKAKYELNIWQQKNLLLNNTDKDAQGVTEKILLTDLKSIIKELIKNENEIEDVTKMVSK